MTDATKPVVPPAGSPPATAPNEPAPNAADLAALAAGKKAAPALGEPAKPGAKAAAPLPASADDLRRFVQEAVSAAIPKVPEDQGPVLDIPPALAPPPPNAAEIDQLFADNKQGEAISKVLAAAASASTPATARLMRQDAFREMEAHDELGPVYKKHRKRIHEQLVGMRLTDAHLSTPQAVDAAIRLVVSQNSDMFDDLATRRTERRLATAGAPASTAASATGPAGASMPGARVEVPGAAAEPAAGGGDVIPDMDPDEKAMWAKMGVDPAEVAKEKERMGTAGKPGGLRAERTYGVEI